MSRTFTKNTSNRGQFGSNAVGPLMNGASRISVAIWAKPASFSTTSNLDNIVLIAGIGGSTNGLLLAVDQFTDANPRLRVTSRSNASDASPGAVRGGTNIAADAWVLLGADIDYAAKTITARINGVADGQTTGITWASDIYTQGSPAGTIIDRLSGGAGSSVTAVTQWAGLLSHLSIWKFAAGESLTDAQWLALAAGTNPLDVQADKLALLMPLAGTASPEPSTVGGLSLTIAGSVPAGEAAPVSAPGGGGGTDAITLVSPTNGRIYQRQGTSYPLALSGTYTGSPTSIEARVVLDGTTTEAVGWTTVVASPAGGNWSGNLTVPQGGMYNVQVRFGNATSVVAESTSVWGVGVLYAMSTQSNAQNWFTSGTGTPTAITRKFNGSWATNTGAAAITFANTLSAALGLPVGLIDSATGGAAVTAQGDTGFGYWLNTGGAPWSTFTTRTTGAGGKVEGIICIGGESDSVQAVVPSIFQPGLQTLIDRMRTHLGQAACPVMIVTLVPTTVAGRDASWQQTNDALVAVATSYPNCYFAAQGYDLATVDSLHYTSASYATLAGRVARAARVIAGQSAQYRGPEIASVALASANTVLVQLTHRGGTDFSPASGITGFSIPGAVITSAARVAADQILLTTAEPLSFPATVRYAYGALPNVTGVVKDNSAGALPLERVGSMNLFGPEAPGLLRSSWYFNLLRLCAS